MSGSTRVGKENSSDGLLTNILYHDWADKNETIVQKLHKVREIKLQIVKQGHCREKRRSKRLSIKQHGHACIRSWYQRAKEPHGNPSDMLWLISSDHHAYSENLVASRASFMILLLQSTPCWNFNRKSHFSVLKVSVKESEVPTEKNSSSASIFATKGSYISN